MSMFEAAAEELQSLAPPNDTLEMDTNPSDSAVTLGVVTKPQLVEKANDSEDRCDMGTKGIEKAAPSPRSLPSPLNEMVEEAEPDVAEIPGEGEGPEAEEAAAPQGSLMISEEVPAATEVAREKVGEGMETLTLGEEGEDVGAAQSNGRWVDGLVDRVRDVKGRVSSATHTVVQTVSRKVEGAVKSEVVSQGRELGLQAMAKGRDVVVEAAGGVRHWVGDTTAATMTRTQGVREALAKGTAATVTRTKEVTAATVSRTKEVTAQTVKRTQEVTAQTVKRTKEVTAETVRRTREAASHGVRDAQDRIRQVRGYLVKGWEGALGGEDEDHEDDAYNNLLCFEKAAEISIGATMCERLPFVLLPGHTVTWEFRVKDHDVGFELCERVQDYGGAREEALVKTHRVKSGAVVKGSYTAAEDKGERSVVLVWDNSYSFFRPKHVAFIVRVLAPITQAEEGEQAEVVSVEDVSVSTPIADTPVSETTAAEAEAEAEAEKQGEIEATPVLSTGDVSDGLQEAVVPVVEEVEGATVATDAVNVDGRIVVIEEESDA